MIVRLFATTMSESMVTMSTSSKLIPPMLVKLLPVEMLTVSEPDPPFIRKLPDPNSPSTLRKEISSPVPPVFTTKLSTLRDARDDPVVAPHETKPESESMPSPAYSRLMVKSPLTVTSDRPSAITPSPAFKSSPPWTRRTTSSINVMTSSLSALLTSLEVIT